MEQFGKRADLFIRDHPQALTHRYCLEALRATLYQLCDQPNPHIGAWAGVQVDIERLLLGLLEEAKPRLTRLRVRAERARQTVDYRSAYDAVLPVLAQVAPHNIDLLQQICVRLGFPDLLSDMANAVHVEMSDDVQVPMGGELLDQFLAARPPGAGEDPDEAIILALKAIRQMFPDRYSAADYERMVDEALARVPHADVARAEIYAWLGETLKELNETQRFLKLVGEEVPAWEENLPTATQTKLWTERGTALRAAGKPWAALIVYQRVAESLGRKLDTRNGRTAQRNLAIGYRETGAPDMALRLLEEILPLTSGEERLLVLESLAATDTRLGRRSSACHRYQEALTLATGPSAKHRNRLIAVVQMMNSAGERGDAAVLGLLTIDLPPADAFDALVATAAAFVNALHHVDDRAALGRDDVGDRVCELIALLEDAGERAEHQGATQRRLLIAAALSHLADLYGSDSAVALWDSVDQISLDAGLGRDPIALLALARLSYRQRAFDSGRGLLGMVPDALRLRVGQVEDLDVAVEALFDLGWMFTRVTKAVVEQPLATLADVRLAADLRRDAIRRSMESTRGDGGFRGTQQAFVSPTDDQLARLAPQQGVVGVIEWIDIGAHVAMLLSVVGSDGVVSSHWLKLPDIDLDKLRTRILTRLSNWTSERPGDPFDLPDWRGFERWVGVELAPRIPDGSHLVIIENDELSGFPWHVAAAPRWTCSYASSWNSLLAPWVDAGRTPGRTTALGVAMVPQFGDREELVTSLRTSARRSETFASANGLPFHAAHEKDCDRDHLFELMQSCDILKILCHGFVAEEDREVAWMIAADGELPLRSAAAADTPAGRQHRFSWRQIVQLPRAPKTIFSAACRTARAHAAGEGERLGLFAPLQRCGTTAMVAPGWDIEAGTALEILDDALEAYVNKGCGLAAALRGSGINAVGNGKAATWLAWALRVEGDWR